MKPLTIEQLKSLEVGDWVWVYTIDGGISYPSNEGQYIRIYHTKEYFVGERVNTDTAYVNDYSDYGTKWVAYKNKEQAESRGEIVELPCIRERHNNNKHPYCVNFIREDRFIDGFAESSKEKAEARLKELRGEK